MTVTLSYDAGLGRVTIAATALGGDVATVERSTDEVRWTTVRGMTALTVTASALPADLYDYEYAPNVANHYRVRSYETGPITYVAAGTASHGNNASVTPGLPAGIQEGDLLLLLAAIRNSPTANPLAPSGWTQLRSFSNMRLFGKIASSSESGPTVTFAGGVADAATSAQIAAFRTADMRLVTSAELSNGSAADIAFPAIASGAMEDNTVVLFLGWRAQDWTSVATIAGATEIGEPATGLGDNQGIVWDYVIRGAAASVGSGSFVVTGGIAGISRGGTVVIARAAEDPLIDTQVEDVTPAQTAVWLKSPQRPFLNREISLGAEGPGWEMERSGRGQLHEVLNRSLPVAQTDVAGSRRYQLRLRTETDEAGQTLQYLLESGDVLCLQAPAGATVPAGGVYLLADTTRERLVHAAGELRHWTIPVREVAPPGPDVAYALSTWATVLALYGTWDDLLAANSTWSDLLQLVGDPSEVVLE